MEKNYEEFIIEIKEKVEENIGDGYEVSIEKALKNNSCVINNMIIKNIETDGNIQLLPAINLNNCYSQYVLGKSSDSLAEEIVRLYHASITDNVNINFNLINRENAEEFLFYRIVNKNKNKEMLSKVPYVPFLDLAVTFHFLCNSYEHGIQSFRINNNIMKDWNLDIPGLFEMAHHNTRILFPERLMHMDEVLEGFGEYPLSGELFNGEDEMYVLSNEIGVNGASVLLYSKKISELSDLYERNIYIIPSSIHEVILMPEYDGLEAADLRSLVNDVNKSCVAKEDRLSDEVYIYDRDSGTIHICNSSAGR